MGVTAGKASNNASNARGVTAGKMGRNSSVDNNGIINCIIQHVLLIGKETDIPMKNMLLLCTVTKDASMG